MVVPSTVVNMIDELYPAAVDKKQMGLAAMDSNHPANVRAILQQVRQLSPEVLPRKEPDRSEFQLAISAMKDALEQWKSNKGYLFGNMTSYRKLHPITVIRDFLSQCADTIPLPVENRPIRGFLSYNTKDKKIVGEIKEGLEIYGVELFLAHEDLNPSEEWRQRIMEELKRCDVFLPALTKKFRKSKWTDQESGIALANSLEIIPLKLDLQPHGFLDKFHSCPLDASNIRHGCNRLAQSIGINAKLADRFKHWLIEALGRSRDYFDAGACASLILELAPYTRSQFSRIFILGSENDQVYKAGLARRPLKELFEKNKSVIPVEDAEKYFSASTGQKSLTKKRESLVNQHSHA